MAQQTGGLWLSATVDFLCTFYVSCMKLLIIYFMYLLNSAIQKLKTVWSYRVLHNNVQVSVFEKLVCIYLRVVHAGPSLPMHDLSHMPAGQFCIHINVEHSLGLWEPHWVLVAQNWERTLQAKIFASPWHNITKQSFRNGDCKYSNFSTSFYDAAYFNCLP